MHEGENRAAETSHPSGSVQEIQVLYCCFWRLKLSVHRRDTSQSAAVQASSICSLCVCFSPDLEVWLCLAAVCHTHEQGMPAGRIRKGRGEIGKSTRGMGLKAVHPCRDSTWNSRHILGEENIMDQVRQY
ncbi:unnamed protein product [Caretta caretta]